MLFPASFSVLCKEIPRLHWTRWADQSGDVDRTQTNPGHPRDQQWDNFQILLGTKMERPQTGVQFSEAKRREKCCRTKWPVKHLGGRLLYNSRLMINLLNLRFLSLTFQIRRKLSSRVGLMSGWGGKGTKLSTATLSWSGGRVMPGRRTRWSLDRAITPSLFANLKTSPATHLTLRPAPLTSSTEVLQPTWCRSNQQGTKTTRQRTWRHFLLHI